MYLWWLLAFRIANALLVQSQFDPDEFWQAGEPAHLVVFGTGHLTWEWAPTVAIRGWLHPLLLAIPLQMIKWLQLDSSSSPELVLYLPRIFLQSTLLAWADYSTCELAHRLGGRNGRGWALVLTTTNWFLFYCGVRTYTNSFEACVLAIVLNLWPERALPCNKVLLLAVASIAVRPTALVSFAFLGAWCVAVKSTAMPWRTFWLHEVGGRIVPLIAAGLAACCALDSWMYGQFVLVPVNFARFNLVRNVAELYGTHPWYWYLVVCLPAILGVQLPAVVLGVRDCVVRVGGGGGGGEAWRLVGLIGFNLAVLSLSSHKELRFALPCVPPALVLASLALERRVPFDDTALAQQRHKLLLLVFALGGAAPALFLSLVHQRAPVDAALYLGSLAAAAASARDNGSSGSVDILLGCHTMPLHSVIHHAGAAWREVRFLDCSPKLPELQSYAQWGGGSDSAPPLHNETYLFRHHTADFLHHRYHQVELPTYIVTDTPHLALVQQALPQMRVLRSFPYAHDYENLHVLGAQE